VESHLPLVRSVARRFAGHGEPLDDLVQVGAIGLVKAGQRFDESRGVPFAAFAAPVIEGEIRHHLRDKSSPLRIPRDAQRASREVRRRGGELAAALGHSPSASELAAALNTDAEQVERALRAELAREALPLSGEREELEPLADVHGDSEDRLSFVRLMEGLDERERKIVFLRFHADMTERQIGRELGISQAQVSRLLSAALARLRAELASQEAGDSVADSTVKAPISQGLETSPAPQPSPKRGKRARARAQAVAAPAEAPASKHGSDAAHYLALPYTVAVQSDREGDGSGWRATVEELPGCAAQGRTPDEAVKLLHGAMESWLDAALAQGREIPLPSGQPAQEPAASTHSGRFLVRMPGALHAELASAAERERLSLNRFVTNALAATVAQGVPPQQAPAASADAGAGGQGPGTAKASRTLRLALVLNLALVILAAAAAIVLLVLAVQHGV
jgi:RNA polymerase sigma-B factor